MIITASYPERGFAKVGYSTSKLVQSIQYDCKELPAVYEFETANDEVWIRSKERRTGNIKDYLEILAEVDKDNNRDADWINNIDPFYDKRPNPFPDPITPFDLIKDISSKPDYQQIYYSSFALFTVEPSKRQPFLRDFYFPWFFDKYPKGKILVLRQDSSYEKRVAVLRFGNLLSTYEDTDLEKIRERFAGIKTMAELHHTGLVNIESYLTALANIFSPYRCPIIKSLLGCFFILFTNEQEIINRGVYPRIWEELHQLKDLMKGDKPDFSSLSHAKHGWLGRYIPERSFPASELIIFFRDALPKLNRLIRLRLDITNYRNGDNIDFISAYEQFYTLDRIMLEINFCQCSTNGYHARSALFSIMDKFAELISIPKISEGETFHYFFKKAFLTNTLIPLLERFKPPFGDFFKNEAIKVYDSLYDTILGEEGLWMSHRKTVTGVNIRKWDKNAHKFVDQMKTFDDFVGMTIRAVRNTHHSYISKGDDRRFATYISLHTGKLPDIFTAIPQLIWLAVLESPETTILSKWISDLKLKSALI